MAWSIQFSGKIETQKRKVKLKERIQLKEKSLIFLKTFLLEIKFSSAFIPSIQVREMKYSGILLSNTQILPYLQIL